MNRQRMDGGMLMDDRPIMFLPKLAKRLKSCEKAIVLQQIHWLSKQPRSGIDHDGYHWVWGTYKEWCEEHFLMWHPDTLRKHIRDLEKDGYLISAQLKSSSYDQTKYYRINYEATGSMRPDVHGSERPDVVDSNIDTETTTETTTETPTPPLPSEEKAARPPTPQQPVQRSATPFLANGLTAGELATQRGQRMKHCQDYDWRIHRDIFEATVDAMGKRALVDADDTKTISDWQQVAVTLTKAGQTAETIREKTPAWKESYWGKRDAPSHQFISFMGSDTTPVNGNNSDKHANVINLFSLLENANQ